MLRQSATTGGATRRAGLPRTSPPLLQRAHRRSGGHRHLAWRVYSSRCGRALRMEGVLDAAPCALRPSFQSSGWVTCWPAQLEGRSAARAALLPPPPASGRGGAAAACLDSRRSACVVALHCRCAHHELDRCRGGSPAVVSSRQTPCCRPAPLPTLNAVKQRMKSVANIQKITKAMKMVAASKMRSAQANTENSRGIVTPLVRRAGGVCRGSGARPVAAGCWCCTRHG